MSLNIKPRHRSGALVAIKPIKEGKFWLCQCDCGKQCKAPKWHLARGKRTSCGCRIKPKAGQIRCTQCKQTKPRSEYYQRTGSGRLNSKVCKKCSTKAAVERNRQTRIDALVHYSLTTEPSCECCGEIHKEFLALDHKNGGGNQHRKQKGIKNLAKWLKQQGWPTGYRVLCHNCNQSLGNFGYCPHR